MTNHSISSRKTLLLFLGVVFAHTLSAQALYDISDFLKRAGTSQLSYEFGLLKEPVLNTPEFTKLNFNYYQLIDSAGTRQVVAYDLGPELNELFSWGWEAIELEEFDSAVVIFNEVLAVKPDFSSALNGIGYANMLMGKLGDARDAFIKASLLNPIDYIAFWSLSTIYDKLQQHDSALLAISHAWVLNRNNPEIMKDFKRFATAAGKTCNDWNFSPQYQSSLEAGKVKVFYYKPWMGYAICKAFWQYEPRFADDRGIEGDVTYFQERECLNCLLTSMVTYEKEASEDTGLQGFKLAMQQKMAMEFILFELFLPENPDMAYMFDASRIEKLKSYLLKTRTF